ncbi:hypothetical protein [Breoghania sp.]|uniref:head-tail joining protein n=1 Tax=Breoghania sp. TaxID=2065378 RepID=UPI002AA5E3CB|nr:hypothetical protein [Breoghania sp.]
MTDWGGLVDTATDIIRDTFAESTPVVYERSEDGLQYEVAGIFDFRDFNADAGGGVPTTSRRAVLAIKPADLGFTPLADDLVEIEGEGRFKVSDKSPSSSGMWELTLRKVR